MYRYVNVDVLFLGNWVVDWAWLWLTARLSGVAARGWRIMAGAVLGAAAAVWACFPSGAWLASWWGKGVGTLLWLAVAFWPLPVHRLLRTVACCLAAGGGLAGAVLLVAWWVPPGDYAAFTSMAVVAGVAVGTVGARNLWEAWRERQLLKNGLWELKITLGGESVAVTALLDTGNHLKDPLAGTPVAVVEASALKPLLPPEMVAAINRGWEALERLPGDWAGRCRLVPFRSVGREGGMLLALAVDELAVRGPGESIWFKTQALVGLASFGLHPGGAYRALLPASLAHTT